CGSARADDAYGVKRGDTLEPGTIFRHKHVPIPLTSLLPARAISYRPMWLHCYLIMLLLLLLLCLQLRALGLAQRL
ncbi:hypothetical protein EIQ03_00005, partial [Xanthomonas campestris pv. raphani]